MIKSQFKVAKMNRHSFNSPKPAPGFVYFQTTQSNPTDTADFLAFSDSKQSPQQSNVKSFTPRTPMHQTRSPMHNNAFTPNFTSSPVHFKRGNNYRSHWNQNRRSNQSHNRRSSSFNSTGSNRSFQNDSWNSSSSVCSPHYQNRKRDSSGEIKIDIEQYIHPSFFEDPWAGLVKKVEQSWAESEAQKEKQSKLDIVDELKNVEDAPNDCQSKDESRSGTSSENSSDDDGESTDSSNSDT